MRSIHYTGLTWLCIITAYVAGYDTKTSLGVGMLGLVLSVVSISKAYDEYRSEKTD